MPSHSWKSDTELKYVILFLMSISIIFVNYAFARIPVYFIVISKVWRIPVWVLTSRWQLSLLQYV
jgi:hypothetical protein